MNVYTRIEKIYELIVNKKASINDAFLNQNITIIIKLF